MSIELFRFDREKGNRAAKVILCRAISSERFYQNYWHSAIEDTGTRLFRDGSSFMPNQIELVIKELIQLNEWCESHLSGDDYYKMHDTLVELIELLPEEALKSNQPFYIF